MLNTIDARFLLAILEDADLDVTFDAYDDATFNRAEAQVLQLRDALRDIDHDETVHIHN